MKFKDLVDAASGSDAPGFKRAFFQVVLGWAMIVLTIIGIAVRVVLFPIWFPLLVRRVLRERAAARTYSRPG